MTSDAEMSGLPEPKRYSMLLCTQSQMACTRSAPLLDAGRTCCQAKLSSLSESQ